jgi:hypothetical protein
MGRLDTAGWTLDGLAKLGWPVTRSEFSDDCLVFYGDWTVAVLRPIHPDRSAWLLVAERSSVWRDVTDVAVWGRDELERIATRETYVTEQSEEPRT